MPHDYFREFQTVLDSLPANDREVILDYWRTSKTKVPEIITDDSKIDSYGDFFTVESAATTGYQFFFRSSKMDSVSLECVRVVVAHELAHAFIMARDKTSIGDYRFGAADIDKDECEAHRIGKAWDYDSANPKIQLEVFLLGGLRAFLQKMQIR